MAGTHGRRHAKKSRGKKYGFHGLRPASSTQTTKSSDAQTGGTSSTPTSTAPSSSS
jgi:hypothetical protein